MTECVSHKLSAALCPNDLKKPIIKRQYLLADEENFYVDNFRDDYGYRS